MNIQFAILLIALVLLITPLLIFILKGWHAKRDELLNYFPDDHAQDYFKQFPSSKGSLRGCAARKELELMYDKISGRYSLWGALFILTSIALIEIIAVTDAGLQRLGFRALSSGDPLPDIAMAAIAGAYMWVVSDFIVRMHQSNFASSDVFMAALRMAIAIPMGYAFAAVMAKDIGPFIAFAIGAFPLEPLKAIMRRLAFKHLGLEDQGQEAVDQVMCLQGINKDVAERFEKCDIYTVSQLSYVDPVFLSQRTNLRFNFILDVIGQALAWNYFGDKMNLLRPLGLRGAHEIRNLILELDNGTKEEKKRAQNSLPALAGAVGVPIATIENTFREIAEDPYCEFIHNVFH